MPPTKASTSKSSPKPSSPHAACWRNWHVVERPSTKPRQGHPKIAQRFIPNAFGVHRWEPVQSKPISPVRDATKVGRHFRDRLKSLQGAWCLIVRAAIGGQLCQAGPDFFAAHLQPRPAHQRSRRQSAGRQRIIGLRFTVWRTSRRARRSRPRYDGGKVAADVRRPSAERCMVGRGWTASSLRMLKESGSQGRVAEMPCAQEGRIVVATKRRRRGR